MLFMCVDGPIFLTFWCVYEEGIPSLGFSQVALLCHDKEIHFHDCKRLVLVVPIYLLGEMSLASEMLLTNLHFARTISWVLLIGREVWMQLSRNDVNKFHKKNVYAIIYKDLTAWVYFYIQSIRKGHENA